MAPRNEALSRAAQRMHCAPLPLQLRCWPKRGPAVGCSECRPYARRCKPAGRIRPFEDVLFQSAVGGTRRPGGGHSAAHDQACLPCWPTRPGVHQGHSASSSRPQTMVSGCCAGAVGVVHCRSSGVRWKKRRSRRLQRPRRLLQRLRWSCEKQPCLPLPKSQPLGGPAATCRRAGAGAAAAASSAARAVRRRGKRLMRNGPAVLHAVLLVLLLVEAVVQLRPPGPAAGTATITALHRIGVIGAAQSPRRRARPLTRVKYWCSLQAAPTASADRPRGACTASHCQPRLPGTAQHCPVRPWGWMAACSARI